MTVRLILMRHAKSSWDDPRIEDHDRVLNDRGRRSATALGAWIKAKDYAPDMVLSSSAARTRETYARLGFTADARFLNGLYLAGAGQMLNVLQQASGQTVLMLGHNPGIAWFATELLTRPPKHPRFEDYPTCATLVADFPATTWRDIRTGTGEIVDFVVPRELIDN